MCKQYSRLLAVIILSLTFVSLSVALDEDSERDDFFLEEASSLASVQEELPLEQNEQEEIVEVGAGWAWGDVLFIDFDAGQFVVNYLDYDKLIKTDIVLFVDEKTVFENAHGLDRIEIDDSVSVDYIITDSDKNIARLITVERIQQLNE